VARQFEYAVALEAGGRLLANGGEPLALDDAWSPEHLVLAGLMRCTLESLTFHAERSGISVSGEASSSALVTKRESGGRYAFVEVDCGLDVRLDPLPEAVQLAELLALAERDCFVGASLAEAPRYEWRVNGLVVER
jgi:organic hydroperoxide reductase OsmC/OhrA